MNYTQRRVALSLCLTLCTGLLTWWIFLDRAGTPEARLPRHIETPNPQYDQPGEAMEHYLRKRLPPGVTDLPVEKYLAAQQQMNAMPRYSTALGRALPSRSALKSDPNQQSLGTWSSLGPGNVGGRTRALLIHPTNPNTMVAAGVAGGVWKTTDGGANWTPISDLIANIAVNSMAMEPGNPNVMYAGTGQGNFAGSAVRGAGIFKTTDGGATWVRLAETNNIDFHYVNDIVISPNNNQRVYAATRTGVWLSTDGGATWTKSLGSSVMGGCLDLAMRTDQTTDSLLASCGTLAQATIFRNTDAAGSGQWASVLTEAGMGRTSLAFAPSNQNVVYALASSIATGFYQFGLHAVFRSTDGGATWTPRVRNTDANKLNTAILSYPAYLSGSQVGSLTCFPETSDFRAQGWFTNVIAVDPSNADRVWVGGIDLFRSDDGGANWGIASYWYANGVLKPRAAAYTHADQMVIAFHPQYNGASNRTLYVTNDGGIYRSDNALAATSTAVCNPASGGLAWTSLNNNFGVTQFYHGTPYPNGATYFGGTQDNGTVRGGDSAGAGDWREIHFGDGGYVAVDPTNMNTLFAENTRLSIHKSTDGGATFRPAITGIAESSANFLFITPFAMDPSEARRLWTGGFFIWRTSDGADRWERAAAITAGLGFVSAVSVAPADSNHVLVGMSTGEVLRTNLGLSSGPNTIWPYTAPRTNAFISWVAFDPVNKNTVYATSSTFGGAHVFKSVNGGVNWTVLDGTGANRIPDIPVHCIAIDPANTQRMYLGTDLGVFVSTNGGTSWAVENTGFANVVTESLSLNVVNGQTQLFAFTHGRGAWRVGTNTAGCNLTLSASGGRFPNAEATGSVNVNAAPNTCAWTAVSNADWITVASGANGTGNGAVDFSLTANNSNETRYGTITIAGRSFNVTQLSCQYTLSQTNRVVDAAGGPSTIPVTAEGVNCAWFASSNAGWITIQSGSPGNGNGAVNYTVAANAGLLPRSGTLIIAGQTFTIRQAGTGTNCAPSPIAAGQTIEGALAAGDCLSPARGGNRLSDRYSFSGTAGQQVAIAHTSTAFDAYLYLIGPNGAIIAEDDEGGPGNSARIPAETGFFTLPATGTYLIDATTFFENRSGAYTIGLTAAPAGCSYALSAASQSFNASGGTGSFNVTTASGCAWMAASDAGWITISSGANGSGNGTVNFSVAANTAATAARTGKITVADQTFTITQQGCSYSIAPASQSFGAAGGAGSITVTATSGCAWNATANADWISITSGASGNGNGTVNFAIAANPAPAARMATITAAGNTFTVTQGGGNPVPALSGLSPATATAGGAGFTLTVNGGNFVNGSVVRWNNADRVTTFVSATQLTAAIPASDIASAGSAQVTVFNPMPGGGVSSSIAIAINNPTPTIASLNPNTATAGGAGFTLTVNGSNFVNGSVVRWNNADRATTFVSATQLTASIPASDIASAGSAQVTVFNPAPGGGVSSAIAFAINNPAPTVSGLSPSTAIAGGAAFKLTVTGSGFVSGATVLWNGGNRATAFAGATQLTADITAADIATASEAKVSVTNPAPGGGTSAMLTFTIGNTNPVPTIASVNPNSVLAGSGAFTLTVTGSNFINGSIVRWNGLDRVTTFVSSTQLTAEIPASSIVVAGTGVISVFNPAPGGGVSGLLNLTIREPNKPPQITSLTPNVVVAGGQGVTVSVEGKDFVSGSVVRLAGANRPTSFTSATRLAGALSAGDIAAARDAKITVFTPDGGGVSNELILTIANPLANVPAASFSGAMIAPDSIVAAFGVKLATAVKVATATPLPTELEGTTVKIADSAGAERLARLFFVSPTQINYLMPAETVAGPATVTVKSGDGSISVGAVQIAPAAPSLFTANASGQGVAAGVALRVKADGAQVFEPIARFDQTQNRFVAVPIDLDNANELVFPILYGSGIRYRSSLSAVTITIGGLSQPVLYAGAVDGFFGLDQLNVGPLSRTLIGRGEVDVVLTVDGKQANTVKLSIK